MSPANHLRHGSRRPTSPRSSSPRSSSPRSSSPRPARSPRSRWSPRPPRATAALLAALLLAPALATLARAVPATPPAPQPLRELRFPAFEQRTLANGLRIVLIERHTVPRLSLRLLVPAGKLYVPAGAKAGLADATADLLTQGTARRSAQQIAAAIDAVGGALDSNAGNDFASVDVQVTSDQLDLAVDLLSDVVLHPSFPADEVERWRRKSLSNLELARANPGYLASAAFARLVYGPYPYGLPAAGTPDSVRALRREDLVAFHRSHYLPNGAILAVAGDVQPARVLASIEHALGGWAKGEVPQPPPFAAATPAIPAAANPGTAANPSPRRVVVIDKPDAVQTQIVVGQTALAVKDPDFFVAEVTGTVLGGNSSGRLFQEIRRKRGLAYGAYSRFAEDLMSGTFSATTSTKTASTVEALRLTLELIGDLAKSPVPAVELNEAKTYMNGSFPLQIQTADGVAGRVLNALAFGLGREYLDTYRDRISAVSAADIQRFAAARIHPQEMTIVLVGNAATFGADLAKLVGPYETIPVADFDPLAAGLRRPATGAPGATGANNSTGAPGTTPVARAPGAPGSNAAPPPAAPPHPGR